MKRSGGNLDHDEVTFNGFWSQMLQREEKRGGPETCGIAGFGMSCVSSVMSGFGLKYFILDMIQNTTLGPDGLIHSCKFQDTSTTHRKLGLTCQQARKEGECPGLMGENDSLKLFKTWRLKSSPRK